MMPKGLLNSTTAKLKPIAHIYDLARYNEHEFSIFYRDTAKDEEKQYRYRCENPDQCSEITSGTFNSSSNSTAKIAAGQITCT